jgi:hypothetical protein
MARSSYFNRSAEDRRSNLANHCPHDSYESFYLAWGALVGTLIELTVLLSTSSAVQALWVSPRNDLSMYLITWQHFVRDIEVSASRCAWHAVPGRWKSSALRRATDCAGIQQSRLLVDRAAMNPFGWSPTCVIPTFCPAKA